MKLSIITDEFTQDLETAVYFAKTYGLAGLELRTIDDLPLEKLPKARLKEIAGRLRKEGLTVSNIAGSFYKCRYNDRAAEMEKLKKLVEAADIFDCGTIRCFGFLSDMAPSYKDVAKAFEEPLSLAKAWGKQLLLEADPSVTTTNHEQLKTLIEMIDHPLIGAIYDPGNDLYDPLREEPFPKGWEHIRPYVKHIHIKDAVRKEDGAHCVKVGTGSVDFKGILKALTCANYTGYLSLECHYRAGYELSEEQMKIPGGSLFSNGGLEACMESTLALKELMEAEK